MARMRSRLLQTSPLCQAFDSSTRAALSCCQAAYSNRLASSLARSASKRHRNLSLMACAKPQQLNSRLRMQVVDQAASCNQQRQRRTVCCWHLPASPPAGSGKPAAPHPTSEPAASANATLGALLCASLCPEGR